MAISIGGFPAFASEQLVNGHPRLPSLDVPKRLVDAANGVVQHRAIAPVRAVVARLPDIVDAIGGLAHEEGLEVSVNRGIDQIGALRKGAAAVAIEAILIGRDLDDGKARARRR